MKIALISDIHANLPALKAILEDIQSRKIDAIYCLGDLVGYNIWPNEVIQAIRDLKIPTLAGNHDLKVKPGKPASEVSEKAYAYDIVGEDERNYLLSLPAHIRLEYRIGERMVNFLFVHGSPRSVDEYLLEDMDENELLKVMNECNADLLCFGHSHKPYHRTIKTGESIKHAINIGSVGKPKDGDARGCYVILELTASSLSLDQLRVTFARVEYPVDTAAQAIIDSPLPDELADRLKKAY
ncbi:MAG: metallophosphoesterase family protein [Sphingobacteriales bacterium]|nr:metallophosphoesterase family protein [Sphingobacteriales bacterium]OJV98478.1 MAG: YfcE family phosphodiesterase [Sphingobacteriales bacterium 44-61]